MLNHFPEKWALKTMLLFLVVLTSGAFLRLLFFVHIPYISFKNLLHAHSHLALLGWVHMTFMVCLTGAFLHSNKEILIRYNFQLWLNLVVVTAMFFSFLFFGYGISSIVLSSLQILLSYWFARIFIKDSNKIKPENLPVSGKFVRSGLFFMILSSLGPWSLGIITANDLAGSKIYSLSIYFYLHFQYNGWFSFALFGLFFRWMENNHMVFSKTHSTRFFWLLFISCIPAYALSSLWAEPPLWVYGIAAISGALQCVALFYLFKILSEVKEQLKSILNERLLILGSISIVCFFIKIILQLFSAIPYLALLTYRIRNYIIGYLHLVLIGCISFFLLHYLFQVYFKNIRKTSGLYIFIAGFLSSELLLFLQSTFIVFGVSMHSYFYPSLFFLSCLMPLGFAFFLRQNRSCFNFS